MSHCLKFQHFTST